MNNYMGYAKNTVMISFYDKLLLKDTHEMTNETKEGRGQNLMKMKMPEYTWR